MRRLLKQLLCALRGHAGITPLRDGTPRWKCKKCGAIAITS